MAVSSPASYRATAIRYHSFLLNSAIPCIQVLLCVSQIPLFHSHTNTNFSFPGFYCGQADHCELGMRFSINAPAAKDMAWRAIDTIGSTTATSVAMPMPSASIVPGTGSMNNGQCSCDCLCGVNAFPAGGGIGMMGGMPGMIPAASAPSMAGPISSGAAYGAAYSSGSGSWK